MPICNRRHLRPEEFKWKNLKMNLLKVHLFLLYASTSSFVIFTALFMKTYTIATLTDIGVLSMIGSLSSAVIKALVGSTADRNNTYSKWLKIGTFSLACCSGLLSIIPFYPQLMFDEPHPQLIWYLVASLIFLASISLGVVITLTDVFIIHRCLSSSIGEHFGHYRYFGAIGWATSSLAIAFLQEYTTKILPNLVLPMMIHCVLTTIDLYLLTQLRNIDRKESMGMIVAISNEYLNNKSGLHVTKNICSVGQTEIFHEPKIFSAATVDTKQLGRSDRSRSTTITELSLSAGSPPLLSKGNDIKSIRSRSRSSIVNDPYSCARRLDVSSQARLLIQLNLFDNHNMIKYLIHLVFLGAISQISYLFYLPYMETLLIQRSISDKLFTFSAVNQLANCFGEIIALVWLANYSIRLIGRDLSVMLCLVLNAIRYAINGYLLKYLNVWVIATLEFQTGLLFGMIYTLMIETGSAYLFLMDKFLLVEELENMIQDEKEVKFMSHLEKAKEYFSIETIRFALKATTQSIFSGACEGIGFALGPLVAGIWLAKSSNSLETLYQDTTKVILFTFVFFGIFEFIVIRMILGRPSRVDRLFLNNKSK